MVVFEFMRCSNQEFSALTRNLHRLPSFKAGTLWSRAIVSSVFQCIPSRDAAWRKSRSSSKALKLILAGCEVLTEDWFSERREGTGYAICTPHAKVALAGFPSGRIIPCFSISVKSQRALALHQVRIPQDFLCPPVEISYLIRDENRSFRRCCIPRRWVDQEEWVEKNVRLWPWYSARQ